MACLLCLALLVGMLPVAALAEDNSPAPANDGIQLLADTATDISYIDANGVTQTCNSATVVIADDTTWRNDNNAGWYVVNSNVTISERVTVTGKVHLILADGYTLNATKGITVTGSNSLTIYGQSGGTGKLTAKGDQLQAGIGGNNGQSGGAITINGGTVNATGGNWAAGIGGGYNGAGGTITINGGTVTAEGVGNRLGGGAGIGGGIYGTGGAITINDGTVNATGGYDSAGIGGGCKGAGGDQIVINGGTVKATSGQGSGVALGAGRDKEGGKVTINGGTVYVNRSTSGDGDGIGWKVQLVSKPGSSGIIVAQAVSDQANLSGFNGIIKQGNTYTVYGSANLETALEIKKGETLKIENEKTLTISENVTLTNNGTITVSGTLTNNGTIVDNGTINGTVSGDVRYPSRVTVSLTQGGQSVASVSYGSTVTITATMQRAQTNGINAIAELGYVNFYLGGTDGTLLGSVNVTTGSNGAYTAALTLDDNIWAKGFNIGSNTITADFGGVAGGSGTGLVSGTGTATLTVTKGSQTAPGAPTMSDRTTTSVTLDTISGGQGTVQYGYTTDGNTSDYHWQTDTTFNNLQPGTDYIFYARYAGNDYYNESQTSTGTSVTTLPAITTTSLAAGYVGVSYSATLHASAAKDKAVTWSLVSGSTLPGGLRLDNNTITGTPNAAAPNHSFTVQATINGADSTQTVTNTAILSITINQGTPAFNITSGSGTYTYGDIITVSGTINPSSQVPSNGINSIAEPAQNQVGLYVAGNDSPIATAIVIDDSFVLSYDTAGKGIPIGENQALTVRYGGSSTLTNGSTTVEITLNPKAVTAQVQGEITKVYDGNTSATVNLAVASNDLVNGNDEITVTGTGTYNSADAGTNIPVTVSNIQATGADSAWYTVSAPTDVTGTTTQATQEAPDAPTVIERTSSSVTLAALGTTGQGALEYGYTTGTEGEPGNWQTGTTFTGLTSGMTYTFYARYSGDNNYNPAVSVTGTKTSTLSTTGPNVVNPGETVVTDDGTKVTNDGEKITITPDGGGTTTTITPDDGTTVNGDGSVNVPGGSTVQIGDGPAITIGEDTTGETVGTDGGITLPDGGSATIGSGDDITTITTPDSGTIKPNYDGTVTVPDGSTVQTGDGPELTLPDGGTIDPDTGAVMPDAGGSVVIGSGEDTTTITPPSGVPVIPNGDGTVTVPDGSTVQTGNGPEMTLPDGGTVDPDTGAVTPDAGGSVVIGSGEDTTTITPPSSQPVTPNDDGSVTIPGGSTVVDKNGDEYTYPPEGGSLDQDGTVVYTVTVTFDSQGGSEVASKDINVNNPVEEPANPTRSGYSFRGWYTAASGGERWDFTKPVAADMTLYAQWSWINVGGPTYPPTMDEPENGAVTTSPSRPEEGDAVTITPKPDEGFEVDEILVKDEDGKEIEVTQNPDGTYTFTQPDGKVTITVTFRCDGGELCPGHHLTDVSKDAWYHAAVDYAVEHGIMEGVSETEFSPNTEVTRAQAVQILYNLEGQPTVDGDNEFTDVFGWYEAAVTWAAQTGVATGYGDGTFQPGDNITRQEFAQMLYNYAKYKGYDLSAEGDLSQFPDSGSVANWAEAAMRWANGNELINGHDDGTIDAAGTAIRAQAASILMKFDQNLTEE